MMAEAPRGRAGDRSRLHHTRCPTDRLLRSTTPEPDKSLLGLSADGSSLKRLGADAAARLLAYPRPGNIRELLNAMKRLATLVRRPIIGRADLDFLAAAPTGDAASPSGPIDWLAGTLPEVIARVEIELIRRALAASGGNRAQAAERLGIRRQLLYQKLARHGLEVSVPLASSAFDIQLGLPTFLAGTATRSWCCHAQNAA